MENQYKKNSMNVIYKKIAVLEICSEKKTRESVVGIFTNICKTATHC